MPRTQEWHHLREASCFALVAIELMYYVDFIAKETTKPDWRCHLPLTIREGSYWHLRRKSSC